MSFLRVFATLFAIAPLFALSAARYANNPDVRGAVLWTETIQIEADSTQMTVSGDYVFLRRDRQTDMRVLYPIAGVSRRTRPQSVTAMITVNGMGERPLQLTATDAGVAWILPFSTAESCEVRVKYRMAQRDNRVEYVLLTARGWPEAISHATLEVTLPMGARVTRTSYPMVMDRSATGRPLYRVDAETFLPDRDLVVEWEAH